MIEVTLLLKYLLKREMQKTFNNDMRIWMGFTEYRVMEKHINHTENGIKKSEYGD